MPILDRLRGRGNHHQTIDGESADFDPNCPECVAEREANTSKMDSQLVQNGTRNESYSVQNNGGKSAQFLQSGRVGYQGGERGPMYETPRGAEPQGFAQTEGVNSPLDVQEESVRRQQLGGEHVKVFSDEETRPKEALHERRPRREGSARRIENDVAADTGISTSMEQPRSPRSPRSPRREGIFSKVKDMFQPGQRRDREAAEGGEVVDTQGTGATAPTSSQTVDNAAANRTLSSAPAHSTSTSSGGHSPRSNWTPVEGFTFRRGNSPPPHVTRREEKAADAVARHDGGYDAAEHDTPHESGYDYSGYDKSGYENHGGDAIPATHDVPHSKPGRYASGDQGGAWGDHRASEVGSFRGAGMHSPSKERPSGNTERPYWIAPGGQNDPSVSAAAAAAAAAAANVVKREGAERTGSRSMDRNESLGTTAPVASAQNRDNSRFINQPDRRSINTAQRTFSGQNNVQTGATSGTVLGGSRRTPLAEERSDVRDFYQSEGRLPNRSEPERRSLERDAFGSTEKVLSEDNVNPDRVGVKQRFDNMKLGDGSRRNDVAVEAVTPRRDVGLQTVGPDVGFDNRVQSKRSRPDYEGYRTSRGYDNQETYSGQVAANQNQDNFNSRPVGENDNNYWEVTDPQTGAGNFVVGGTTEAETPYQLGERISDEKSRIRSVRSPAREQSFGVGGATRARTPYELGEKISDNSWNQQNATGMESQGLSSEAGVRNRGITDQETGIQNSVVGSRTVAETPNQVGERISDERSRVRNVQSPAQEQNFGVGGETTARTPYELGEKISDKSWNITYVDASESQGLPQAGGHNRGISDPNTGTRHFVVGGRTEVETPYQPVERIPDERSRGRSVQSPAQEQSFGVGGETTARTPYELGEKISDKSWNKRVVPADTESQGLGSQAGVRNRDVTDPETGAQNFVVGGRTEAETPYQLGERISDERSRIRNVQPAKEQNFGVGGAITARTPYELGEKISDKSWRAVPGTESQGLSSQAGVRNRDVTDPETSVRNFVVGGRTEAETPYQLGERISDERSRVRNVQPAQEQNFGVGGAITARTPYELGEKISDKSWRVVPGTESQGLSQAGSRNRDITDQETGAENFVVDGRTEAETPYQLGERISDERSRVRNDQSAQEQNFGVGGGITARTPFELGEKISDRSWRAVPGTESQGLLQAGNRNRDTTDPETGAQNTVVGGRTEAETPYQLGERISDERSRVRNVQSSTQEQSFGVGGGITARTPYELGEKISDKSWNGEKTPGANDGYVGQSECGNRDVTNPRTGAQNFVVGGRTEAETPYQLGEKISDERSRLRSVRTPAQEQNFGVGGSTAAQSPSQLGGMTPDQNWNQKNVAVGGNQALVRPDRNRTNGAQNIGVGNRTEIEAPHQLGERITDDNSRVRGSGPVGEQSFGVGGPITARTPYGLGERISDKSWNDGKASGVNTGGFTQPGLEAGALGAGAMGVGAGLLEANRMHASAPLGFQRSTSTGEPLLSRQNEVALGSGKALETPVAAAAATQHAAKEQSDMDSGRYVREGATIPPQAGVQESPLSPGAHEPPLSPGSRQYYQHGEPVRAANLLTTAKYALGRASTKLSNTGHHLTAGGNTISSVTGVAFGKLDLVAKRMLKGGEYLWREAFHPSPEEHLRKSFACLLSTENGAVAGVLYLSDHSLWFCSDRALQRAVKSTEADLAHPPAYEQYLYKVVLPLAEVGHIETRTSARSERDKSIKVEMSGGEQFWFFGFVTFEKALLNLQHAADVHKLRSASMKAGGA